MFKRVLTLNSCHAAQNGEIYGLVTGVCHVLLALPFVGMADTVEGDEPGLCPLKMDYWSTRSADMSVRSEPMSSCHGSELTRRDLLPVVAWQTSFAWCISQWLIARLSPKSFSDLWNISTQSLVVPVFLHHLHSAVRF